jgi:hypothetical protein
MDKITHLVVVHTFKFISHNNELISYHTKLKSSNDIFFF